MLPKKWWTNPKLIQLYIEHAEKMSSTHQSYQAVWYERIKVYTKQGLLWSDAQKKAAEFFLKNMITKGLVPSTIKWKGKESSYDMACSCCDLFAKAGIIKTPGKLRYLGYHPVGMDSICVQKRDEDGEPYFEDEQFLSSLDMYRCEVCSNEWTDGY